MAALHNDVAPSVGTGERFHWFSTTGWVMWNAQVGGLLGGTTICLYDGNPGGPAKAPDWGTLWRFAAAAGVTWFGAGAAFFTSCMKAGIEPMQAADLSRLLAIGSTGSPLPEEGYQWISRPATCPARCCRWRRSRARSRARRWSCRSRSC
jgi:acetoacetyl-CoA synthetase